MMVGRVLGDQHDARDGRHAVWMRLERRIPEVLRIVVLGGEIAGVGRLAVSREHQRERDVDGRAVRALGLTGKIEHLEIADAGSAIRIRVGGRALAFQRQHREAFAVREEIAREGAERKRPRSARRDQFRLADSQQFDENAGTLHDAIVRTPGMAVARADREAELRIARPGRVEVVHGVNDMVETSRDSGLLCFVMAGLVPAIHALPYQMQQERRGCPRRQVYAACASLAAGAGMTEFDDNSATSLTKTSSASRTGSRTSAPADRFLRSCRASRSTPDRLRMRPTWSRARPSFPMPRGRSGCGSTRRPRWS